MDTWHESFFDQEWGRRYPGSIDDERTAGEVDVLVDRLGLEPSAALLDAPCGDGRHSVPLAQRGFRVTGLDLTPAFLDHARGRAAAAGVDVEWRQGDLRELPFEDAFDGAFCWFGSFGYFDDAGDRAHLSGVVRALRPGGVYLMETLCLEGLLPRFRERDWEEDESGLIVQQRRIDLEGGRIESHWRFERDGEWRESRSSIRLYTIRELRALFEGSGFEAVEMLAPDGAPFELGAERVTVRARAAS